MNAQGASQHSFTAARRRCLVAACMWLILALLALLPAFAGYGYARYGAAGLLSAALAAALCLGAGTAALVCTGLTRGGQPQAVVGGALLGMLFRLAIPLAALLVLRQCGGSLLESGAVGMLLVYYLLMLVIETWLTVRLLRPVSTDPGGLVQQEELLA